MKVVKVESKEENARNDQRELKNKIFQFRMIVRNGLEEKNRLQYKEDA